MNLDDGGIAALCRGCEVLLDGVVLSRLCSDRHSDELVRLLHWTPRARQRYSTSSYNQHPVNTITAILVPCPTAGYCHLAN